MPKLTIVEGGAQSVYEIFDDQAEVTIGRGAANGIQVGDGESSKHHAAIWHVGGQWKLVDLESRNGIRVNGAYQNQHWLTNGDVLGIGDAELRYEGPVHVAPTPAAAPEPAAAPMLKEVAISMAPPAPAAAPAAAPAPAALPAPGAAPSRRSAAPSRGRGREDYDDDEDYDDRDERPSRRRGDSKGPMIVVLAGLGAIAFVFLMMNLMGGSEKLNQDVRMHASAMAESGDLDGAVAYAKKHGDPTADRWRPLKEDLESWQRQIAHRPRLKRNAEAVNWFQKNLFHRTRTSTFRAKDPLSESDAVARLHEFLSLYRDTRRAKQLLASDVPPYAEYRAWMMAHTSDAVKPAQVMGPLGREVDQMASRQRFGDAIRRLEQEKRIQMLTMSKALAQEMRRMLDARIVDVQARARNEWSNVKSSIEGMIQRGEKRKAGRALQEIIDTWGYLNVTKEAQTRLDDLR